MEIESAYCFLIAPGKHLEKPPAISSRSITSAEDSVYRLLNEVFARSEQELKIDIGFTSDDQSNDAKNDIEFFMKSPSAESGLAIAKRLQAATNRRPGFGLLFLIFGQNEKKRKVVISRFPAGSGLLAEMSNDELQVSFVEKIFMKQAKSYKAVAYELKSAQTEIWKGKAIDKQINSPESEISDYWVKDFLLSDFLTTGPAGTRRLAISLRMAATKARDLDVRSQIIAASQLTSTLDGKLTSGHLFAKNFGMSQATQEVLKDAFKNEQMYNEKFRFTSQEFKKHLAYKTVELDNHGIMSGPIDEFETIFVKHESEGDSRVSYSTAGKVVKESIKRK